MFSVVFEFLGNIIKSFSEGLTFLNNVIPKTEIFIGGGVTYLTLFTLGFFLAYITYAIVRWVLI